MRDLPARDWRIGTTFLAFAAMQALAIMVARRYFRLTRLRQQAQMQA